MFYMIVCMIVASIAGAMIYRCIFIVGHVKRQIREMVEILEDVKKGNGNRRILSEVNELVASLAYNINEIILTYEDKLSEYHKTEETNRQLMTSLSHDVRTPLTTLIGYLDALYKGMVSHKEHTYYIKIACQKAHHLKNDIDTLFEWFKLGSNEYYINLMDTDLTDLTRTILIDWIPILEEKQIDFIMHIPEKPFFVQVDRDSYGRVMNNLMQNIVTHSQAQKIKIAFVKQEKYIKIDLIDNGIGMDKETLKHIFKRLYRGNKKSFKKSSGLGLSITYQLVEKMNGTITVNSTVGKGTIFTLFFPLAY